MNGTGPLHAGPARVPPGERGPDLEPQPAPRPPRTRKSLWRRLRHLLQRLWHDVISQHDAPHRIALGVAIGFLVGWLPLVGIQMLLCLGFAWLLRGNFLATLPGVWLSNPVTMVPMYWLENRVGSFIAGRPVTFETMAALWGEINELVAEHGFWIGTWSGTQLLFTNFLDATVAMLIGGTLLGLLNAALVYYPALRLVQRYHEHRRRRRQSWSDAHRRQIRDQGVAPVIAEALDALEPQSGMGVDPDPDRGDRDKEAV